MGEARLLVVLLLCVLVPAAPLAAAAPTCADGAVAQACVDAATPSASADNASVTGAATTVPRNHVSVVASNGSANATSQKDGWRWSASVGDSNARACGWAVVVGSSWINFGCTDPSSPPSVSTDPNAWIGFVTGVPGLVTDALPCRLSGRNLVCDG